MRQPAIAANRPFTAVCNTGELFRIWADLPIASSITESERDDTPEKLLPHWLRLQDSGQPALKNRRTGR